jgi:hypothetical protein
MNDGFVLSFGDADELFCCEFVIWRLGEDVGELTADNVFLC